MFVMRSYVIGDIHGCLDELRYLIEGLRLEVGDRLVFLGDYIDRPAPRSSPTYWNSRAWTRPRSRFLKAAGCAFVLPRLPGEFGDMFFYNGGQETLESYGLGSVRPAPNEALSVIPPAHLNFYQSLIDYYIMGDTLCVHAGINPLKSLEEQTKSEVLWIRDQFIYSPHSLPYTVLCPRRILHLMQDRPGYRSRIRQQAELSRNRRKSPLSDQPRQEKSTTNLHKRKMGLHVSFFTTLIFSKSRHTLIPHVAV
jgi:serine/threonine protein phosphatase 1